MSVYKIIIKVLNMKANRDWFVYSYKFFRYAMVLRRSPLLPYFLYRYFIACHISRIWLHSRPSDNIYRNHPSKRPVLVFDWIWNWDILSLLFVLSSHLMSYDFRSKFLYTTTCFCVLIKCCLNVNNILSYFLKRKH